MIKFVASQEDIKDGSVGLEFYVPKDVHAYVVEPEMHEEHQTTVTLMFSKEQWEAFFDFAMGLKNPRH